MFPPDFFIYLFIFSWLQQPIVKIFLLFFALRCAIFIQTHQRQQWVKLVALVACLMIKLEDYTLKLIINIECKFWIFNALVLCVFLCINVAWGLQTPLSWRIFCLSAAKYQNIFATHWVPCILSGDKSLWKSAFNLSICVFVLLC